MQGWAIGSPLRFFTCISSVSTTLITAGDDPLIDLRAILIKDQFQVWRWVDRFENKGLPYRQPSAKYGLDCGWPGHELLQQLLLAPKVIRTVTDSPSSLCRTETVLDNEMVNRLGRLVR